MESRTVNSIAVVQGAQEISYTELDALINKLAQLLIERGVRPDTIVGIHMDRSIEMVVSVHAVLRAGGAYLPLDCNYPSERLCYILEDSQLEFLITQSELERLHKSEDVNTITISPDFSELEGYPAEDPDVPLQPQNLAYCIYTSGSTGKPKGTLLTRSSTENMIKYLSDAWRYTSGDRVLQFASFSFDAATAEILCSYHKKSTLVLRPKETPFSFEALKQWLFDYKVSNVSLPPSVLASLNKKSFPDIKTVISVGEACTEVIAQNWSSGSLLINGYGPTETTVVVTNYYCEQNYANPPPIGQPLEQCAVYILDENLNQVSGCAVGELYIGGSNVGRGYLNRPALTAEKFLPDPFSGEFGARIYRTGDLGYRNEQGDICFIGRVDHQVKVRGSRVELGEVDAALLLQPEIKEAATVLDSAGTADARLISYLVIDKEMHLSVSTLHSRLEKFLPTFMVPSAFVFCDALPLTPNGKVDRHALANTSITRNNMSTPLKQPRGRLETELVKYLGEILRLDKVGVLDNFIELGGTSLNVIQFRNLIESKYQVTLPTCLIFELGNVERIALAIIEKRLNGDRNSVSETGIGIDNPEAEKNSIPVSMGQHQVLFLDAFVPDNRAYQVQVSLQFDGALDIPALSDSLSDIVARHEMLHTTFHQKSGILFQQVEEPWKVELEVVDISHADEDQRVTILQQLLADQMNLTFDVSQLPLVRWQLFKVAEESHLLLHVEHHLIHDGWSFRLLVAELAEIYSAKVMQHDVMLENVSASYFKFCYEQRKWLESSTAEEIRNAWVRRLDGITDILTLGNAKTRPPQLNLEGSVFRESYDCNLVSELQGIAKELQLTLFQLIFSSYALFLQRYSSNTSFLLGTSLVNRNRKEYEQVIGMFVNVVPVKIEIVPFATVRENVFAIRESLLWSIDNGQLPLATIVEAVNPNRPNNALPLIQYAFNYHDSRGRSVYFHGLKTELKEILSNNTAKFDLNVTAIPSHDTNSMELVWEFNTSIFDVSSIEQMAKKFQVFLRGIRTSISQKACSIDVENGPVEEIETKRPPMAGDVNVARQLERQVDIDPQAIAVRYPNSTLTYEQLNGNANQIAHHLQALGVGPGCFVGICLDRERQSIEAILAIVKAGAAYVPFHATPRTRAEYIMAETKPNVVVSERKYEHQLAGINESIVYLDELDYDQYPVTNLTLNVESNATLYVMFTSGSTGRPKSVVVTHYNVINLVAGADYAGIQSRSRLTHLHQLEFDASVIEIWGALLNGAELVVLPSSYDFNLLIKTVVKNDVSTLFLPTSVFEYLVDHGLARMQSLKHVVVGGDTLSAPAVKRAMGILPTCSFVNGYGPTECTTYSSTYSFPRNFSRTNSPIGIPIDGCHIYLLDQYLQKVPKGVTGEIYIAGAGVSTGYLNAPVITAESFLPDPFCNNGTRMYRTGDQGRLTQNGLLEFKGRMDFQVKVRGYRVELSEVESTILQHNLVSEVCVLVEDAGDADKCLIAYVVPARYDADSVCGTSNSSKEEKSAIDIEMMRSWLAENLPEYCLPSKYFYLESMPLNSNGKIDRKRLPSLGTAFETLSDRGGLLSRTMLTEQDADILSSVIELINKLESNITIDAGDNFYQKGLHSLSLMKLSYFIQERFNIEISVSEINRNATALALTKLIRSKYAETILAEGASESELA